MAQLKKDGAEKIIVCNKLKGKKSEVYPFQIEDMKKMITYFKAHNMWNYYLMFVLSCNLARRVGDMLSLRWVNFFDPKTGGFRKDLFEIVEEKTNKLSNPHINAACREAINDYIHHTKCKPYLDSYNEFVFLQLSGNYRGRVMSDSAYLKALKKAALDLGIEYNVGTHSGRKTFGMMSRMLHPNDYDSMELLRSIYNHSSTSTTSHYIGLTKQKVDAYYDDMGNFFTDYVTGEKELDPITARPVVTIDKSDLYDIIKTAFRAGKSSINSDGSDDLDIVTSLFEMVEDLQK